MGRLLRDSSPVRRTGVGEREATAVMILRVVPEFLASMRGERGLTLPPVPSSLHSPPSESTETPAPSRRQASRVASVSRLQRGSLISLSPEASRAREAARWV
jgi:hypothetical protein